MKQIKLLLFCLTVSLLSFGQTKGYLKYDSVYIQKDGGSSELVLLNSSKDTAGFLFNKGNGRTEFRRVLRRINDSVYLIGQDTLKTGATHAISNGKDGSAWRSGSGVPSGSIGINSDFYINSATGDFYQKISNSYVLQGNFKGATGAQGLQGQTGATGSLWRSGTTNPTNVGVDNDYFLNSTTGEVFKRISGTYVSQGNIKGAAGINGTNGSTLRNGSDAPLNSLGANGDYYLDVLTGNLYEKQGGSYVISGNLKGAKGDPDGNNYVTSGTFNNDVISINRFGLSTPVTVDLAGRYPLLSGSYYNPNWLSGLHWNKLFGTPTTISGYGLTDAQQTLISGTNIKTINGVPILGSGDITIASGSGTVTGNNSVTISAGVAQLVNDGGSVGANKVYGTNGSGVKGWIDLPSGTGGTISLSTQKIFGRYSAGTGAGEEISLSSRLLLSGGVLDVSVNKSDVGLSSVDNTSDLGKPISTATQTALNAKQASLISGTNIKTINGNNLLGSGDITIAGGGSAPTIEQNTVLGRNTAGTGVGKSIYVDGKTTQFDADTIKTFIAYSVRAANIFGSGDKTAALQAIADNSTQSVILLDEQQAYTISGTVNFKGKHIRIENGAHFSGTGTITNLFIDAPFNANIFDTTLTVTNLLNRVRSVIWFGAKADYKSDGSSGSYTNNLTPFNKCFSSSVDLQVLDSRYQTFTTMYIPAADVAGYGYWLSNTFFQNAQGTVYGDGAKSTLLFFPSGLNAPAWWVRAPVTSAGGFGGTIISKGGSDQIFHDFSIFGNSISSNIGAGGYFDNKSHGIRVDANKVLGYNFEVWRFKGDGIHVFADVEQTPATNANNCTFRNFVSRMNGGSGMSFRGGDANNNGAYDFDCSNNGRWGTGDYSFLANKIDGGHVAGNGYENQWQRTNVFNSGHKYRAIKSVVKFVSNGGNRYQCILTHDRDAANSDPGTGSASSTYWTLIGAGGADDTYADYTDLGNWHFISAAVVPGVTSGWQNYWEEWGTYGGTDVFNPQYDSTHWYTEGGGYLLHGLNGRTVINGSYPEGDGHTVTNRSSSLIIGGFAAKDGNTRGGIGLAGNDIQALGWKANNAATGEAAMLQSNHAGSGEPFMGFLSAASSYPIGFTLSDNAMVSSWANGLGTAKNIKFVTRDFTSLASRLGRDATDYDIKLIAENGYYTQVLGSSNFRLIGMASAPPTSGNYGVGDVLINNNPSSSTLFWQCSVASVSGNGGTWVAKTSGSGGGTSGINNSTTQQTSANAHVDGTIQADGGFRCNMTSGYFAIFQQSGVNKFYITSAGDVVAEGGITSGLTLKGVDVRAGYFADADNTKGYIATGVANQNFTFNSQHTDNVDIVVNGLASKTADFFQLKNDAGTVLTKFDKDGKLATPALAISSTPSTTSDATQILARDASASGQVKTIDLSSLTGDQIATITTGDATATTIATIALPDNSVISIDYTQLIDNASDDLAGKDKGTALIKRTGSTVTVIDNDVIADQIEGSWAHGGVSFVASGTSVLMKVTGTASKTLNHTVLYTLKTGAINR